MDPPPRRNKYGWPIIDEPDEAEPAPAEPAPAEVNPFDPSRPLSSVEKRILRHAGGVGGIPALLAKVDRLASEVIETASPSSRRHYDLAKHIFEACVATYSMPVRIEDYWAVEIVRTYAPKYLSFRVNTSDGRQGERVKAITVLGWYSHIIVVICKYTHDPKTGQKCGGALLYTEGLHDELENQLHKEALSRHSLTRGHSFGLPEVKLCIESGLRDSTSRGREARVQEIAMLIIGLATGVRACGLVGTEAEYIKEGKYMKAGDLKVSNHGNTDYSIELRIMNHKASARVESL
ncbi:hypothetical protein FRC12_013952 [Ceratobasidium sp. 428]|nr:hypothetical protein FRC12_013952 [Ceratobasidium sp. 428]